MTISFWVAIGIYIAAFFIFKALGIFKPKYLQNIAMWSMISGIIFLCQPFSAFLFKYGIMVLIFGLIYWNIANNMKPESEEEN